MDQYTIKILQTQRPPSIYNNQESVTRSRNPASAHDFGALTTPHPPLYATSSSSHPERIQSPKRGQQNRTAKISEK